MMRLTDLCDIIVVGGGPAGSTTAFLLASKGFRVHLFDKQAFPRTKVCAGLLTWKTIQLLEEVFHAPLHTLKAHKIVIHSCRDYRIFCGRRQITHGRLDFPFHFTDRRTYDFHWLQRAREAGVQVETTTPVTSVDPINGSVTTRDGRRIQAGLIIGADGVWSTVRRSVWNQPECTRLFRKNLAMSVESSCSPERFDSANGFASLHFGFVPWGYAWSFPNPAGRIIGMAALCRKDKATLKDRFSGFIDALNVTERDIFPVRGWALPYGNYLHPAAKNRVLLVGDACGLADPLLGEGIYYAHRSAQLAVQAILATGAKPKQTVKYYNHLLKRGIIANFRWINFFRTCLFAGGKIRRFRGLKLMIDHFPKKIEAAVQGKRSFKRLLW